MAKRRKTSTKPTAKTLRPLTPRQQNLVDALPMYDWSVIKAGIAVGYKPSYASTDLTTTVKNSPSLSKAIEQKRAVLAKKLAKKAGWTLEWWREQQAAALQMAIEKEDLPAMNTALRQIGMNVGVFEEDNRQRSDRIGIILR